MDGLFGMLALDKSKARSAKGGDANRPWRVVALSIIRFEISAILPLSTIPSTPDGATIWAFNKPGDAFVGRVATSVKEGKSRFGWSYVPDSDLRKITALPYESLSPQQKDCLSARFLLGIKRGDWIVHINVPSYGSCIAAQVCGEYGFDETGAWEDFRHYIPVDPATVQCFSRNDPNVLPIISRRLKLQGRHWRISAKAEFLTSLDNIKNDHVSLPDGITKERYHLGVELNRSLDEIARHISKTHPEKKLERLVAEIFRNLPGVTRADVNAGWGTDYGADVIVYYVSGPPALEELQTEGILVIQVKSYTGQHSETNAVRQLKTAILKYNANSALLISTAESTKSLADQLDGLRADADIKGVPVGLLAGREVARFMLQNGASLLLQPNDIPPK